MNKQKLKTFFEKINSINRSQNHFMNEFVSQANDRAGAELNFEWEDKSLYDYVDLRFNEVQIFLRDIDKNEDNTHVLIKPINDLIKQFNNRLIDYYEFILKYKQLERNLIQANTSERYSVYYDNFELMYFESKTSSITGVGGMGKSHFLWECQNRIQNKDLYKSLFLYGKFFIDIESIPWEDIQEYSYTKEFLLVIDGINEISDIDKRKYVYEKIKLLSKCKHIRIFVSYRTYSLLNIIDEKTEDAYLESILINKINFAGVNFDSSISEIVSNFKVDISYFYRIIYSNNPMYIRMLIESDILNSPKLYDEFQDRSVVNITFIYERFIKTTCKRLWKENEQPYWDAIKNLSKTLYDSNRSHFTKSDLSSCNIDVEKFLNDLKNGGYIVSYDNLTYYFLWEQLSNYLIARSFNDEIKGKSDEEICVLFAKKSSEFPMITQFLLSVLIEKYHKNFNKFISFVSKVCPKFSEETLLNITIKNANDRKALQEYIPYQNEVQLFSVFGGIPNRIYNCESFLFEYFCSLDINILKPAIFFNKEEIVRKLKCNLNNINGKYFVADNSNEFIKFAILCLLIPDNDIIELSEKTIYDLIELYDKDFSKTINYALKKCKSPLLKRSISNIVCQLSSCKQQYYSIALNSIERETEFVNAKILTNYCKFLGLSPYAYVKFKKVNLFKRYCKSIPKLKANFDELKSLNGLISIIRFDKLFYSLNIEHYNNLKLNFELLDSPSHASIIKFNKQANLLISQYNKCDCNIDVWNSMFNHILNGLKKPLAVSLVNQEDLFFGFVAHLEATLKHYGIDEDDTKWYKENRYRQHKLYPDNITTILNICVEEYIGSLMCNYFQNDCEVSYWGNKIYLGYAPISYDEEQINLYSPLRSYNTTIDKLDIAVISRLNDYKRKKDAGWADNKRLSLFNIKNILKPYTIDGNEWVLLGSYINNRTRNIKSKGNENYSNECIIVNCATNYQKNRKLALDRKVTIEIQEYKGSLYLYNYEILQSDFCKIIKTIKAGGNIFNETNLAFPPSSLTSYLGLTFDSKKSAWLDCNGNDVIICNNGNYREFYDNIGRTIYIRKEYYDKIEQDLGLYYYIFTEKLSYETGHYSNKSDMHIIIKNNRIRNICKNTGDREIAIKKMRYKCSNCLIYNTFQDHQQVINYTTQHYFNNLLDKR